MRGIDAGGKGIDMAMPVLLRLIKAVAAREHQVGLGQQALFQRQQFGRRALEIGQRSEEHTSELQSLMRISYAVFCLKKKNTRKNTNIIHIILPTNSTNTPYT